MTTDEFFAYLTSIRNNFTWTIKYGRIRGYLKDANCDCCKQCFCPITAVARIKKGYSMPENGVEGSAQDLNLDINETYDIILSADNHLIHHKYRPQILEAVGLV